MTAVAFLNPFARSGEGRELNEEIKRTLRAHHGEEGLTIADEPIPDAEERALRWQELLASQAMPLTVYPSGGDGTLLEVTEAALKASPVAGTGESAPGHWRMPRGLRALSGIGTGSAQDIKATIGFPVPEELDEYLGAAGAQRVFNFGAVWLVTEDAQGHPAAKLANHSLSYGLVSYVFALREKHYETWKADPENKGKKVPLYLSTLTGRVLHAPLVAFKQAVRFLEGFRGHTVIVRVNGGEEMQFNDTAVFGVLGMPLSASYFGVPMVNPLAGDDFRVLVAALPYHPMAVFPLAAESLVRGFLTKIGFRGLVGSQSEFLSLKWLNRFGPALGIWDPQRVFTLTHGDTMDIEIRDRVLVEGGMKDLVEHDGVAVVNGDIHGKLRKARIVVGPREQTLPFMGKEKSVAASLADKGAAPRFVPPDFSKAAARFMPQSLFGFKFR